MPGVLASRSALFLNGLGDTLKDGCMPSFFDWLEAAGFFFFKKVGHTFSAVGCFNPGGVFKHASAVLLELAFLAAFFCREIFGHVFHLFGIVYTDGQALYRKCCAIHA